MNPIMLIEPNDPAVADEANAWTDDQTARWGYVPNYAAAFTSRPEVAKAWTALNIAVRDGMDRRRFEIATIAAARAMQNTYCTLAHSKFLRDACHDMPSMVALANDANNGALDETDRAVVAFAGKVARNAADISADDMAGLRSAGLSDNDIADVVFAVATRSFFTRVLEGMGVNADHELTRSFEPSLVEQMVVGRPVAAASGN